MNREALEALREKVDIRIERHLLEPGRGTLYGDYAITRHFVSTMLYERDKELKSVLSALLAEGGE